MDIPAKPVATPQRPVGNFPVGLDRASAQRTEAAVKFVEGMYRGGPRLPAGSGSGWLWLRKAKTGAGGINPATANDAPTPGAITFCDWDEAAEKWVPNGETGTALNPSTTGAIAANWIITVGWVSGKWEAQLEPC